MSDLTEELETLAWVEELEAENQRLREGLEKISKSQPEGDSSYKYGYTWERCIEIARKALEEK